MPDERYKELRLDVTNQEPIYTKPNGSTLFKVWATGEDGLPVPSLRTFAKDLIGTGLRTYTLKRYEHPEHGVTWTILDPSGGPAKTTGDDKRLADLETRVKELERRIGIEPEPPVHPAQHKLGDEVRGPDFFGG